MLADDTAYGQGLAGSVRTAAASTGVSVTADAFESDAAFLAMGEVEQSALMRELRSRRLPR